MISLHDFIWEHRADDPAKLALSAKKHPDLPLAYIARQVEVLRKIRRKIPSWYREGLDFPVSMSLEQASSEATARFKSSLFSGKMMADLTGGLGVDAAFFASKFKALDFLEKIPEILAAAEHNLGVLGLKNIAFSSGIAEQFLGALDSNYDLIYLDPARRNEQKGKVFQLSDCSPNVIEIKDLLLDHAPKVLLKTAPFLDIRMAVQQLKYVSKIWVVEYDGDCREVLYLLEREAPAMEEVPILAVSLNHSGEAIHAFEFSFQEEQQAATNIGTTGKFLYEPISSVLKAGAFKTFAQRFGLHKMHSNTHLYTSNTLIPNLPARIFRIQSTCKYDKKSVDEAIKDGKANISTRNFPDNAEQVRKKLRLRDGGDTYIFAATDVAEKRVILVCEKV